MRKILGNRLMASAVALVLMGLLPLPANAGFVTFQVPGAPSPNVTGINDAGTVAGWGGVGTGFLRDAGGNITTFTVPGLASTIVTGINNAGTVVGYNTLGYGPGFLRDAAGNITTFQIPGLSPGNLVGVVLPVINDAGTVAGVYSATSNGALHGFVRDTAGNITTFDAPGSSNLTRVLAINDAGTVLGTSNSPTFPNYLRDAAGNFTTFSVPRSTSTAFDAINDAGTVAGIFFAGGLEHGFLHDAAGNFTTFDVPGATGFSVDAINNLGMVAGVFHTADGLQEGFLRDAAGNITAFDPLPAPVGSAYLNNNGVLAGTAGVFGFVGTIPEPPSIVLLSLGAAGLAILRGHRRRIDLQYLEQEGPLVRGVLDQLGPGLARPMPGAGLDADQDGIVA
jgi:hypothetical protein